MKVCKKPGCEDQHIARGLCRSHYDATRREKRQEKARIRYATDPEVREKGLVKHIMARARKRADSRGVTVDYLLKREGRDLMTGRKKSGRYSVNGSMKPQPAAIPEGPEQIASHRRVIRRNTPDPNIQALKRRLFSV